MTADKDHGYEEPFDRLTVEGLRATGSLKWSLYPDAIGAFVAEMDFGTAPAVSEALHAAVAAGSLGYLPPASAAALSVACAEWSGSRYGWAVDPDDVRPVADVITAFRIAVEHFSAPGSPVILPVPAYMPFLTVPEDLGREIITVPMVPSAGRLGYDLDALDAAFRAGGNLLVLCNPHNPIGRVLERSELEAVAEVVDRHGGRVFSDEIHAPLTFPGHSHVPYASVSATAAAHTLTAVSASKAWNVPGLKCAQLVLSGDEDRRTWSRIATTAEHGASTLGVVAGAAAYRDGGPWLEEVLAYLDGNRRLLARALADRLPHVRYTPPEGTYLAWLDCRELRLPEPPATVFLHRAGVALTDGSLCGDVGTGFVRLNLAMPRPVLVRAVEQMAAAVG